MTEGKVTKLKHDFVIYSDRWQREDLGKIEVTEQFIEFVSDDRHVVVDIDTLQEARIERDVVKILDVKQEIYLFKFLKRPPYQKWYSTETYYDIDEQLSRKFVSLIYSIMKSRKAFPEQKEKVIMKEVVLTPCKYCGGLIPQTVLSCPQCGARKK